MSGKLRLESQPVDLARVALAAIDVVSPTAAAKNVTIASQLQHPVMPMMGDPDRLQQIVWNLLANAIKFTEDGGRVTLSITHADGRLTLSVADTGEGISPEFVPHLFERFQQADRTSHRRHAGLGLGLSLVRQLVELHGGRISAASKVGEGSTFTVSFPSRPELVSVAGVGVSNVPALASGTLTGLRVVVVADDPDVREMLTIPLERYRATVVAAASVAQVLETMDPAERPAAIVVSDGPGDPVSSLVDALEALAAVHGAGVPAIAVTSDEHPQYPSRLVSAGYRAHLARPVGPAALVAAILSVIRER
jgi:CheY-like chemotaxis protein